MAVVGFFAVALLVARALRKKPDSIACIRYHQFWNCAWANGNASQLGAAPHVERRGSIPWRRSGVNDQWPIPNVQRIPKSELPTGTSRAGCLIWSFELCHSLDICH